MSDFLKNHWASIAFVMCALAMFATEVYVPFTSPLWSSLIFFAALSAPVFFLGCGVNVNDTRSWTAFLAVSIASAFAQGIASAYLLGNEHYAWICICVVFFALWYFLLVAFAIRIKDDPLEKMIAQSKGKGHSKVKRFFFFGEPVQIYKHKITQIEEKEECYKLEFDAGTWTNLKKLKRKGRKPAPPKVGDDITLYFCNGDLVACDLRGRKWFRSTNLEER